MSKYILQMEEGFFQEWEPEEGEGWFINNSEPSYAAKFDTMREAGDTRRELEKWTDDNIWIVEVEK
jgi:hypothetical protein